MFSDPWSGYSDDPQDQAELVSLLNRRSFDRDLARAAEENPRTVALISMDVDHLKKVNDKYGHPAGDKVLVRVARALRRSKAPKP